MKNEIMDRALTRVSEDVDRLIEENREKIKASMREQMIAQAERDPDGKLSFSLTMGSTIEPQGDSATSVETTIAWSVKTKKSTDSVIDEQQELPFENDCEVTIESGNNSVSINAGEAATIFKRAKK